MACVLHNYRERERKKITIDPVCYSITPSAAFSADFFLLLPVVNDDFVAVVGNGHGDCCLVMLG